ncbi:uncharacterized protein LOC124112999 [Haliotis rufescens]|uniref:uncharacterized protein LOC124112999 n=1 Tax=Haliotis rufescens TaxID=6454 RepID=UPI00201EDEED|nr:uncharacterized protein LOC124112999 [Haliotis rufescens]
MPVPQRGSRCTWYRRSTIFILVFMTTVYCTSKFHCPQMVELGSSMILTCYVDAAAKAHSYATPRRTTAASCDLAGGRCIPVGNFAASVINTTCSVLTVPKTRRSHGGVWKCVDDADDPYPETCHVTVVEIPTCDVTSDKNISSLNEGDKLALSVHLSRGYCSEPFLVTLTTGSVNITLTNHTVVNTTVWTTEFLVTGPHFGEVSLMYACGGSSWNVSCEGVHRLAQDARSNITTSSTQFSVPPTSDGRDTEESDSHTGVSVGITVAIIFVIVVVIIFVILFLRKKRKKPTRENNQPPPSHDTVSMLTTSVNKAEDGTLDIDEH